MPGPALKTIAILTLAAIVLAALYAARPVTTGPAPAMAPRLSEQRRVHILYGDATGGGHIHGAGKPCKSEFPASWDATGIILRVRHMAANDNVRWKRQDNGYFTSEQTASDGTRVRVVLDRERDDIVTAYPVNVKRNACPAR